MNLKILCVDDEKDILALCKSMLEISGFLVTTVDNGLDALLLLNIRLCLKSSGQYTG